MFFIWLYGRYWMHLNRKYLQRHKKKTIQCRWAKETCSRLSVQILVSVTSFSIYCTLYCQNFFRVSNISDLPKTKAIFVGLDKKKNRCTSINFCRSKLSQTSLFVILLILFLPRVLLAGENALHEIVEVSSLVFITLWSYLGDLPRWYYILTRARVAVSATFAMVGGGAKMTPPLTRKLGKLEGRAIRRSTALSEPVRSHFGHFFAQVNIEVSRGHKGQIFEKWWFYQECRPLSREL